MRNKIKKIKKSDFFGSTIRSTIKSNRSNQIDLIDANPARRGTCFVFVDRGAAGERGNVKVVVGAREGGSVTSAT